MYVKINIENDSQFTSKWLLDCEEGTMYKIDVILIATTLIRGYDNLYI